MKGQFKGFDFSRRDSRWEDDHIDWGYGKRKCFYTTELVSSEGAHYHAWFSPDLTKEQLEQAYRQFKTDARAKGDPVSFSWDYLPT